MGCGKKWLADVNVGKTQLVSFDQSNNTGAIDVKVDGSALEEKSSFKMLGIFSLIRSMKFLSPELALYLYKCIIQPYMEYCCHVWAGAPSCYLEFLDKLQKWICMTVGLSFAASLKPLAHPQNAASLSLLYRYYFGRCSSELAQLVPLPYSQGRFTCHADRLDDFFVYIPRHSFVYMLEGC